MTNRKSNSDAAKQDQGSLFALSADVDRDSGSIVGTGLPKLAEIPCTVMVERLPKGLRVSARDIDERTLWGFVASRGILEQPHAAIAVYSALREALDPHLDIASRDTACVPEVINAALNALSELEQMTRDMRGALACRSGKKPTTAMISQAAVILRGVTDAVRMLSQELVVSTGVESAPDERSPSA